MMFVHIALVLAAKLSSQGDAINHRPSTRLAHSSHSANTESAAVAKTLSKAATIHAFQLGIISAVKPNIHGEINKHAARSKFAQSCVLLPFIKVIAMATSSPRSLATARSGVNFTLKYISGYYNFYFKIDPARLWTSQ